MASSDRFGAGKVQQRIVDRGLKMSEDDQEMLDGCCRIWGEVLGHFGIPDVLAREAVMLAVNIGRIIGDMQAQRRDEEIGELVVGLSNKERGEVN